MADDVSVTFGASIEKLIAGIHEATNAIKGFAEPLEGLQSHFAQIGEAIAGAFAVEKISEFFEKMSELGVQTQRTAALLGISASSVSGLDVAAKASGGSLEGMTMSLERFGVALVKGEAGGKQQTAALQALGMSAKDFVGVPLPDVLSKLADSFSVMKDGIDKDAIAMALLGRGGAQMIPIFNQGSHAFEEFAAIAKRAGSEATPAFLSQVHQIHEQTIELDKSWQGLGMTMTGIFGGAFAAFQKIMIDLVQSFNDGVREGGSLAAVLKVLAGAVQVLATALVGVIALIKSLWTVFAGFLDMASTGLAGFADAAGKFLTGSFSAAAESWNAMKSKLKATSADMAGDLEKTGRTLVAELVKIWQAGATEYEKIEQTKTAHMVLANASQVSAAMKAIDQQIKLLQEGLKQKTLLLDGEVKQHQITQNTKFAQLQMYTEQAYQAELALLQKEQGIGGMTVAQQQDVLNKISQLKSKHATEMLKLDQESIAAQQKLYDSFFSGVQGAFNSQLRGLLAGTTTWAQAFKNILGDLLIKFIEYCEKSLFEYLAAEIAKTTATTTGAASRAAAEVAGSEVTLPARAGKFLSDITSDAAVVFAGIFANMAPLLGPAAAGPAAAGQATVLAELANVPKFDVGTNYVNKTGLALIHEGEQIRPAQGSGPYQAGGGNSMSFTFQVQALDTSDVQSFFQKNGAKIASIVSGQMNRNPSLRPSY
jgi:hypothetical protein